MVCVIVLATSFSFMFFSASQTHEMAAIRDKAYLVAELLNHGDFDYFVNFAGNETRMTIIAPDGSTIMDNYSGADFNENRADREEFIQAIAFGYGESVRQSETLGAETFYYAIRLENGDVLRLSRTLHSLGEVFPSILPMLVIITIVILLFAYFVAFRVTRKIIKPLGEVDLENATAIDGYEELWPYIRKIGNQRQEIASQMKALKNRAGTIDTIIENMREGLIILDKKGKVMSVNQSAKDIFDMPGKAKNIQHIYRDPEFMQSVKGCLDGVHLEMIFSRNDKIYKAVLNPVTGGEHKHGAIIFFLDITAQAKAETQRKEFSANVSHELKTPLTTISALSEMMEGGMVKAEDMTAIGNKISRHTKRLISIIEDIIRLSEFDENKIALDFTPFDVFALAKSTISTLEEKAAEKAVTLKLEGEPLNINGNSRLIDELLYNLIDNGIKYNKDNGSVTVSISQDAEVCKINVSDTGIGIAKEHQERVFERFYRVDSSRSKKTGGTGLGLSIVKHIAEHHHGKVMLTSTEGVGTTITCYLQFIL